MNTKQKITVTTITLCVALAGSSLASGAPTSQFGFKGWPYRQSSGCPKTNQACEQTVCPTVCPTICPTVCPTECPTEAPEATVEPTSAPQATAEPTREPTITEAPTATAQPTATPSPKPTVKPTAAPTATAKPQTPVKPTVTPSTDDDYTTGSVSTQEENGFLLLNADRSSNGRSALTLDPELCRLARMKSYDMFANNYFAHTSPTLGSAADMLRANGYSFASVGENIAHHATVEKAEAAFMSSTGHRTNILGSQWTKVGIGVCYDSQGFVYVTQLFVR